MAISKGGREHDRFTNVVLSEDVGTGCCTDDDFSIGAPLIGEGSETIWISNGGGISGERVSLDGRARDEEVSCRRVVGIGDEERLAKEG